MGKISLIGLSPISTSPLATPSGAPVCNSLIFGFSCFGDAELVEHCLEAGAARALAVEADRLRIQQRAFESIDRADIRLRRTCADRNAHAGAGDRGARRADRVLPSAARPSFRDSGEDGDVECRALFDLSLQHRGRAEGEDDLVFGRFLELRAEFLEDGLECGRAQHLEFGRLRLRRQASGRPIRRAQQSTR